MATPLSLLPRRPPVTSQHAVTMATRLFNLKIDDPSSVKELDSYDDRTFLMRGTLRRNEKMTGEVVCKEYILKIVNQMDTSHKCLIQAQCDAQLFLQARGYICPTPVPSIHNTYFLKCKVPKEPLRGNVALETDGVTLKTDGVTLETDGVTLETDGVTLETDGVTLETDGVTLNKDGAANSQCRHDPSSADTGGNLGYGIEIYDGKEYCEEEFVVFAVRLLNFVPGKLLVDVPLTIDLLFNGGMAVGRMDRDLKDFSFPGFERPGFVWDLTSVGDTTELFLGAVNNKHHRDLVREVCQSFREQVAPKLHLLPKQIIHGDANYTNTLLTADGNFGYIDFGDLNYTCRVFELAISLMYILNVDDVLSCGRTRMAGYFFAGYQSINPLSDEELQLLHVLVASRFCQSLVYGAYTNKYLDPDNVYLLETADRNGWRNFEAFWKLSKEEVLKIWLEKSEEMRT